MNAARRGFLGVLPGQISGQAFVGPKLARFWPGVARNHFELVRRLQASSPVAIRPRALSGAGGSGASSWPDSGPAAAQFRISGHRANPIKVARPEIRATAEGVWPLLPWGWRWA